MDKRYMGGSSVSQRKRGEMYEGVDGFIEKRERGGGGSDKMSVNERGRTEERRKQSR